MLWWFCSLRLDFLSSWPLSITQACSHVSCGVIKTPNPHVWGASLLSVSSCHTSRHRSCRRLWLIDGYTNTLYIATTNVFSDNWPITQLTFPSNFVCAGDDGPEEEVHRFAHGHVRLGSFGCWNHRSRSGGQVSDDNNDTCLYGQTYAHMFYPLLSIIPPHQLDFITPCTSSSALRHTLTSAWHSSPKKKKKERDGERRVIAANLHFSFNADWPQGPYTTSSHHVQLKDPAEYFILYAVRQ